MEDLEREIKKTLGHYRQMYVWTKDNETYLAEVDDGKLTREPTRVPTAFDLAVAEKVYRAKGGKIYHRRLPDKYMQTET